MTMKRITLFIALGSLILGIIVCFWPPAPCQDGPTVIPCLNGLVQIVYGFQLFVPGIILLILIPIANSRHPILAMIGVILNFVIAITFFVSIAFDIPFLTNFWIFEPVAPLKIILGIGFLFAALSANIMKTIKEYNLNESKP